MIAEDREYIERALSGESAAFDGLVKKYNRMAGAIAYGIVGDFGAAEDIVQEAFLKAYRIVVTLKHMEGLSYREIADLTGSTVSAVESRLFRARLALRKRLDRILK